MARIFLDANYFISLMELRDDINSQSFASHKFFVSTLSVHILFYVNKIKVPNEKVNEMIGNMNFIALSDELLMKALKGPTSDLEDNIQLHSLSDTEADYFLTRDQDLLKMKFFGKAAIVDKI